MEAPEGRHYPGRHLEDVPGVQASFGGRLNKTLPTPPLPPPLAELHLLIILNSQRMAQISHFLQKKTTIFCHYKHGFHHLVNNF